MARIKSTKIINGESISSGGERPEAKLPGYTTKYLTITQWGANVTDTATLAEILAGFGTIELSVQGLGTPVKWDADDLFYFNRDVIPGRYPFVSGTLATTADNQMRYVSLVLPLCPLLPEQGGMFDPRWGIPKGMDATISVDMGTDTAAGMDARSLTVTAVGVEGDSPTHFMGSFLKSFTSVLQDNFQKVSANKTEALLGAYLFTTTGLEDITSTDDPGVRDIGYAVSGSPRERYDAAGLLGLRQNIYAWPVRHTHAGVCTAGENTAVVSAASAAGVSDYYFADFGMTVGGVPYETDLEVHMIAEVAEAFRLYPILAHRLA